MNSKITYQSKIICPNTAKIIHRERLFNELDKARQQAKIIWIAAPCGSGKTTLVSSYLEKQQISHCWYQIDEEDGDLATFFHYLGLAGKLAAPRRKKAVLKLPPEHQQGVLAFTRHFFRDLSSRLKNNGLIVLDNYQLLPETAPISVLLPNIVESLAPGVSLLIISRHRPPPSTISFVVKRQVFVIDTKKIRFTEDEWVAASQLFNSKHSKNTLLSMCKKLDGWIAGLVLLPNTINGLDNTDISNLGIETLDAYVAEQFLSSLDEETSELLMKICYMSHITASSATFVSNIEHSKKLLVTLAQKNLFVLRHGGKGYTLHPLVKKYLQQRTAEKLSKQQLYDLRYKTAKALLKEGGYEAAADLFLELKLWQALIDIISKHAAELYNSGRMEPLQHYINSLPEKYARSESWINYWNGKLATSKNVISALDFYEIAYTGFMKIADARGAYLTWYAVVSTICNTLLGADRLAVWVSRYNELNTRYPMPPPELPKDVVDAVLLHAYFCSGLDSNKRKFLQTRLALAINKVTDSHQRLKMMSSYIVVACVSGVKDQDKNIIENFDRTLAGLKEDTILYLGTTIYGALSAWSFNDFNKLLDLELQALEIAKESAISVFDSHIHSQIIIAALGLKKFHLAEKHINFLKLNLVEKDLIYQSLYMTSIITAGTVMDKYKNLDSMTKRYLNNLENTHLPPFILHTKLLYLYYLCVREKTEEALSLHDELLEQAIKLAFPAQLSRFYLIYAKIFFDTGEPGRADKYLIKSFFIISSEEIITYLCWQPALMAWACQRALTLGIETGYINQFVKSHYSSFPKPNSKCHMWPWAFRVFTFGCFRVDAENHLEQNKQRAGKPYALLKMLVAAQGESLSCDAIKEKLYIDTIHDKTSQLFDTQVYRLRKYFGDERIILRHGDQIKLNLQFFWIDTLEFEALGKQKITSGNTLKVAARLQQLYRGEYLPGDDALDVVAIRERYRNIYLETLFKCIDQMQGNPEIAIDICRNALMVEPLSEPLYRKLISIYLLRKNRDMAEATLSQCRMIIKRHLDSNLSNETLSLLNTEAS
ncbi:hypothetical protein MNBD_GAMMA16-2342 [hydrothermal vent metagenome]|uniref:Bacterial transcriptional activator domain-containing protein n=1 Tax=hydrothermal vent metagenome TaxID=652676 RepID=A0A3B0Z8E9_9ZZZZ